MCGINGFITKNSDKDSIFRRISIMNDLILHRGPDDDGVYIDHTNNCSLAMGMRRLSIIDLTSGKQPISNDDGTVFIVFNGEIYNYLQLKSELLSKKVTFKTTSDTEVILKLYEKEGVSSFSKLDGMFAFSIYDKKKGKIFIARDFFGEKPLYYTNLEGSFVWASELKSIISTLDQKPDICKKGLNHFLRLTYIPAPYSIYQDIHKLEADSFIEYDLPSKEFRIHEITKVHYREKIDISFEEAKKKTKEMVTDSVASRSIADVPLGTWLSGGVDSSIVSLCLSKVKEGKIDTFSIGFEKKSFDETDKSSVVAKLINSNHHEFIIGEDDLKNNIHEILLNFDEPFSDTAALPTYLVSKKTRDYVKVALTGDGGDEVFGGYNKYYIGKLNARYTSVVPRSVHKSASKIMFSLLTTSDDKRGKRFKARKTLQTINYDGNYYWDIISLGNTEQQLKDLILEDRFEKNLFTEYKQKTGIETPSSLTDFRNIDRVLSLEGGMLAKVDRTSMQNSLECRAPFLNKDIWKFTESLPESFLMRGWSKKYILKQAFKEDFPDQFLEKSKQGFGSPVGDWLRSGLRKELELYIDTRFLEEQGIFNITNVTSLVKSHLTKKQDNTFRVWAYYCFQKWYKHIYLNQ